MTTSHTTPVHPPLNCGKGWVLGACNTCVKLHSRVTSSGATVNSWMIWFYFSLLLIWLLLLLLLFCLFLFFFSHFFVWFVVLGIVGLFVDVCSSSLHCCCHCFGLFLFLFSFLFVCFLLWKEMQFSFQWGREQGEVIICWSVN